MHAEEAWIEASVKAMHQITPEVMQIDLAPEGARRSCPPGSHLRVEVLLPTGPQIRSYSVVAIAPSSGNYRIAVRRQVQSRGGSDYMWQLQPGARIRLSHPQNYFELSLGAPQYLFIAGGIGITPLVRMIGIVAAAAVPFRVLYLARNRAGMPYLDDLQQLCGDSLQVFCSESGTRANLESEIARVQLGAQAYLCGPLPLMNAVRQIWLEQKRLRVDLRFETFGSGGERRAEPFTVHLADRQISIEVSPSQSILEAVRAAGVPALADCMRGECGVCAVKVLNVEGALDHRDIFLSAREKLEQRCMCICISRVGSTYPEEQVAVTIDTGYRGKLASG